MSVAQQIAAPEREINDATGRYEGAELARIRARRPTAKRLERLEEKDDEKSAAIARIDVSIADIRGDQKAAAITLAAIQKAVERDAEKEHAEELDAIDARKSRRAVIAKALGLVLSGGVIGKALHMLGWL